MLAAAYWRAKLEPLVRTAPSPHDSTNERAQQVEVILEALIRTASELDAPRWISPAHIALA